jgi:prepilin-type N-terminal cleavage/methylation domain-containing protein
MTKKIKYKGFTLIELLAVITIIGVVLLIAVPAVTSIIENAKDNVFHSNERLMAISAENYYKMNSSELPGEITNIKIITLDTLISEGLIKRIKSPKDETSLCTGYVVVEKVSENIFNYTGYLNCGDIFISSGYSVAPVITLIGSNSVNVTLGTTYIDAGAIAFDDIDGDVTSNIIVVNNVNTSIIGTYTVTYNVTDSEGNTAIQAVRTVNVTE